MTQPLQRRQQRAVLAALRRLCERRAQIRVVGHGVATVLALEETSSASIDDARTLVVATPCAPSAFQIVVGDELFEVPVADTCTTDGGHGLVFAIALATQIEHRARPRTRIETSYPSPLTVRLPDGPALVGRARWRDRTDEAVAVDIEIPTEVSAEQLQTATFIVQGEPAIELRPLLVRDVRTSSSDGELRTTATIVARTANSPDVPEPKPKPKRKAKAKAKRRRRP